MTIPQSSGLERGSCVFPEKLFYQTHIPVAHNQLRQLVSSPQRGKVYLANSSTVLCIDTKTKTRSFIKELPFSARCTATGHGWFCAGGETNGLFAAFRLPGDEYQRHGGYDFPPARPDGDSGVEHGATQNFASRRTLAPAGMHRARIGDEIVNGISIHRIPVPGAVDMSRGAEIVAVVTNNDRRVRIFSLSRGEVTWESKRLPAPVNHAALSPDGNTLCVVGDCSVGHLYVRTETRPLPRLNATSWVFLREFALHTPQLVRFSTYFTTAWSHNGRLLATASEHGFVVVFDALRLLDGKQSKLVVATTASSRAMQSPGAVRSLCFAPAPWDLLAWTENYGRVCFADLRNNLTTVEHISLDPNGDCVVKCTLNEASMTIDDMEIEDDIDLEQVPPSLRRSVGTTTDNRRSSLVAPPIDESLAAYLRVRSMQQQDFRRQPSWDTGLTEEENQIIDNLREARQAQDGTQVADFHMLLATEDEERARALRVREEISTRSIRPRAESPQQAQPAQLQRQIHQQAQVQRRFRRREPAQHQSQNGSQHQAVREVEGIRPRSQESEALPARAPSEAFGAGVERFYSRLRNSAPATQRNDDENGASGTTRPRARSAAWERGIRTRQGATRLVFADGGTNPRERAMVSEEDYGLPNSDSRLDADVDIYTPWQHIQRAMQRAREMEGNLGTAGAFEGRPTRSPAERLLALDAARMRLRNSIAMTGSTRSESSQSDRDPRVATQSPTEALLSGAGQEGTRQPEREESDEEAEISGEIIAGHGSPFSSLRFATAVQTRDRDNRPARRLIIDADGDIVDSYTLAIGGRPPPITTMAEGIDDNDSSDWGIGTTGLAWGADGRTVYVGTEKGVFELKMDFTPRKFYPAIATR